MAKQRQGTLELKFIFLLLAIIFVIFLLFPMLMIAIQSLSSGQEMTTNFYGEIFAKPGFGKALTNSIVVSSLSGVLTTILAFILAYAVNYTNIHKRIKKSIAALAVLPMFLPTITYGFAIIYSFGKQGLITMLLGKQPFEIYGYSGLLIGYVIYTLPISFMLINNTMGYIDKKFMIVSRAMGDNRFRSFMTTVITPLLGTFAASFIQSFFLSFTDYGIPTSVGGNMDLIANMLYNEMLGSLPNFHTGSAVAVMMLLPSIISILLLTFLERYNIRYSKISTIEIPKNRARDSVFTGLSLLILVTVLLILAVIFIVPFAKSWPYALTPTLDHIKVALGDESLIGVYQNSLLAAILTAALGTLVVYGATLISARSRFSHSLGKILDSVALVTNTIPGMVLGVAFLLAFKGTQIQNTFFIIIICNIVHFFSSPYLMMKNSLEKLNASWESTAKLMGDSWFKTVVRIITPNTFTTLLEVFNYYFINAMVTVSAVIFIAGARTMVITTKIKELQHFADFNEIFVLSILILATNIIAKGLFKLLAYIKIEAKKKG
ncbi:MAG: ABC transporter permease subunit [Emergencia timonensis]|uniref:ABC transporter permease subunit n=1 Tax=Emergencia timonensis TaxID=1776384 RepID=UPI000832BF1A|nr:ABC transporter permease subunit [Emergencia timonensis]